MQEENDRLAALVSTQSNVQVDGERRNQRVRLFGKPSNVLQLIFQHPPPTILGCRAKLDGKLLCQVCGIVGMLNT